MLPGTRSLRRRHYRGNQRFHCVRVNAVVELRERSVQVPRRGEPTAFLDLETLELLDQVELEFDGDPGRELEGDVLMGECAAMSTSLGQQPDRSGGINPLRGREHEAVQARLSFKPLEFEGFKSGIVDVLPDPEKLDRIPVA